MRAKKSSTFQASWKHFVSKKVFEKVHFEQQVKKHLESLWVSELYLFWVDSIKTQGVCRAFAGGENLKKGHGGE